ncbi:MAG: DUF4124 domain-containing protein [Gammaproteobacteria bacterium]|nr:DUF4124 domain-containing protein [Gammaproteobacteria bacterium]MDX2462652.1 DUF4124 domain-containing protein [Gammaproteobacteria bacterium]
MKLLLPMLCLALICASAQAQKVYRVVQPDGTVEFTDSPPSNRPAEEIHVQPLNSMPGIAPTSGASTQTAADKGDKGYSEFRITSPGDNTSFWDTAGNVNVDLLLKPSLQSGDKIDLQLDGRSVGGGRSTAITLAEVDRGTHSLQAMVKNSDGKVVARSNSVTFTIQRGSQMSPQRRPTHFSHSRGR